MVSRVRWCRADATALRASAASGAQAFHCPDPDPAVLHRWVNLIGLGEVGEEGPDAPRWVLVLGMARAGRGFARQNQNRDIAYGLRAVRGLTVVSDTAVANNGRFFALTFRQPADHLRPWLGSCPEHRVDLLDHPGDRPDSAVEDGDPIPAPRRPRSS